MSWSQKSSDDWKVLSFDAKKRKKENGETDSGYNTKIGIHF